jgi:hypothetical protein
VSQQATHHPRRPQHAPPERVCDRPTRASLLIFTITRAALKGKGYLSGGQERKTPNPPKPTSTLDQKVIFDLENLLLDTQKGSWDLKHLHTDTQKGSWDLKHLHTDTQKGSWDLEHLHTDTQKGSWGTRRHLPGVQKVARSREKDLLALQKVAATMLNPSRRLWGHVGTRSQRARHT